MLEYVKGLEESWPFREAVSIQDAPDYYGRCTLAMPHPTCTALQAAAGALMQTAKHAGSRGKGRGCMLTI